MASRPESVKPPAGIDCSLVTPAGVVHRLEVCGTRTFCGRAAQGERVFERARDAIRVEGRRPCRSCFRAWRAR